MSARQGITGTVCSALLLVLLVIVSCSTAFAAPRVTLQPGAALTLAFPLDRARVEESVGVLEVDASIEMRDVQFVVSRYPFDPSAWRAVPEGGEWFVAAAREARVRIAALGLPARTETAFWWAVVGTDAQSGVFRSSEVRQFTLVPRFTNRVAPDAAVTPATTGWLPADPATTPANKTRAPRPIHLAAGHTVVPGSELPQVSAASAAGRGAYLVQFVDASPDAATACIARAGGTIVATLSNGTYLVRIDERRLAALATDPSHPAMASWEPAFKLSPRIDQSAAGRVALTALVFPDSDAEAVASTLRSLGASEVSAHRNGINQLVRFEIDGARVAEAAALTDVTWIEPTPRDSFSNAQVQWVVQTNVPESRRVWDAGVRGQGQVVMIADSGIRTNHELFDDPSGDITGFGDYPLHRKVIAYKRGSPSSVIAFGDEAISSYHGTHTSGTVAGNNDATTTNPYDGIAKDAKLYFMDLGGNSGALGTPPDLNDLFRPSYEGNASGAARISSNSWGAAAQGDYTVASMTVDQFMWEHPDYLVLFANGNNFGVGSVNSPATAKNCISVGGTGNGAARTEFYPTTSRGPTNDLRRKPTICAPGDLVTSSVGTTRYAYSSYSGTSMATPAVAGAMALVRQYLSEGRYPSGLPVAANAMTPSAALLKAMAINSGENDVAGTRVPDNNIGWGRLNIDNVLYLPGDSRRVVLIDPPQGLMNRQFVEYQVQVTPGQPLSISLCWTDAPGNPIVVHQLVNDLDLIVTNGTVTYLGNRMFNGVSLVGAGRDSLNVEECVRVPTPSAGLWTVRVEGRSVPVGPQAYALCISGGVGQDTGSIALDRYDCAASDTLEIEVVDTNAAAVAVSVSSPTEAWGETVALAGVDGVFRGRIVLAPVTPNRHDRRLSVSAGDVVTVTYVDAAPSVSLSATARVNGRGPVITDVHALPLSGSTARITWTTDVPATSRVRFGTEDPVWMVQETSGYTTQHAVRLSGLLPGRSYLYDVESANRTGDFSRDSFGGMHRTFTTKTPGRLALVLNEPDSQAPVLATWMNALNELGWDVDVFTSPDVDPPLVGNKSVGLRSYSCVLWQVGVDDYPPFSDAQRAAVDSLLEGGVRLLVTGHDIGYGLSDASVFSYSPEREAWLERSLKTRYYYDEFTGISTFHGVSGDPISDGYAGGIPYFQIRYGSTSDLVGVAPESGGVGTVNWRLAGGSPWPCGVRWESDVATGHPMDAFWGGRKSRLAVMYFEWAGLASSGPAHAAARTDVLEQSVAWLLGRRPPEVTVTSPVAGEVVTADVVPIRYSIVPDAGGAIAERSLSYSLDGGESWTLIHAGASSDSVYMWDLRGAGGPSGSHAVGNSTRALVRVSATDDGAPGLSGQDAMDAVFTIARPDGDRLGPVLVGGTLHITPAPVQFTAPATLVATFSEAGTGVGQVVAAEYSLGSAAAAGGAGSPMVIQAPATTVEASVTLAANSLPLGPATFWVRARDTAGNWGPAAALQVVVNGDERTDVDGDVPQVTFVAGATPSPFRDATSIRFGLAEGGEVRLELFDVRGRQVRALWSGMRLAGTHVVSWDGRDDHGVRASAGVIFVRLTTPTRTYSSRLVLLR